MFKAVFVILLVIVLIFVAMTQWFAGVRERDVKRDFPPLGQMVDVDGVKIHTVVMGQGPDVVLIHGASGSLREFTFDFAKRLATTHRVFIVDRPGLGLSDLAGEDYGRVWSTKSASITLQADLIRKATAQLGATKPIVVGHSYGGAVALAWGTTSPETLSGLVTLGGVSNPWETSLGAYYVVNGSKIGGAIVPAILAAYVSETKVENTIASIFEPQKAPEGYADYVGAELVLQRSAIRSNARQVSNLLEEVKAMVPNYGKISVPTVIFHGDKDTIVPLEIHSAKLVNQVPDAELVVLPGVGHMPHHTNTEDVLAAIKRISGL